MKTQGCFTSETLGNIVLAWYFTSVGIRTRGRPCQKLTIHCRFCQLYTAHATCAALIHTCGQTSTHMEKGRGQHSSWDLSQIIPPATAWPGWGAINSILSLLKGLSPIFSLILSLFFNFWFWNFPSKVFLWWLFFWGMMEPAVVTALPWIHLNLVIL